MVIPAGADAPDPGEIARHAEQGGERAMAYRYAMMAAASCEARFAYDDALTWLDLAASVSTSDADTDAVNRTTARLLEVAGWHDTPRPDRAGVRAGRIAVSDFDLPARV
jgi:hypothetical protein